MKPILFNTEMVRAILDDRKSVTRRVVKPGHLRVLDSPYHKEHPEVPDKTLLEKLCLPPYQPGDTLWVRETWCDAPDDDPQYRDFLYLADYDGTPTKWRPSIHMPREAARLFLRVTDVRVERLQDIDDDGVVAEGLEIGCYFDDLWNNTIKPSDRALYGWAANPWVWVIEFERISKDEALGGGGN